MSFLSVLKHIGQDAIKIFKTAETLAPLATPFLAIAQPQLVGLYSTVVQEVMQAQVLGEAVAANNKDKTNEQKLALVSAMVAPKVQQILGNFGSTMTNDQVKAYINAVVESLNLIPAPTNAQPTTVTTTNNVPIVSSVTTSNH